MQIIRKAKLKLQQCIGSLDIQASVNKACLSRFSEGNQSAPYVFVVLYVSPPACTL